MTKDSEQELRVATLENSPDDLLSEHLLELIYKINDLYGVMQDGNSLILRSMEFSCTSIFLNSKQEVSSIDPSVKGVFAAETSEFSNFRADINRLAFAHFKVLLMQEITGQNKNISKRNNLLVNLFQTYMINARIQRSPYLLQPALTQSQFFDLSQKVMQQVPLAQIKPQGFESQMPDASYDDFALTHALLAYAYAQEQQLRFEEYEQLLEVVYKYLIGYSFINHWLGLAINLQAYVYHYYPDCYLSTPIWDLVANEDPKEDVRIHSCQALCAFVKYQINNLETKEQLHTLTQKWFNRDLHLDFEFFCQKIKLQEFGGLEKFPFPDLRKALADASYTSDDDYRHSLFLLRNSQETTYAYRGFRELKSIEQGLEKLDNFYLKQQKMSQEAYLKQKVTNPAHTYAKKVLTCYQELQVTLAQNLGLSEEELSKFKPRTPQAPKPEQPPHALWAFFTTNGKAFALTKTLALLCVLAVVYINTRF
ncbi:hypothetical protein [Psittacicella gerlachiana]|uniref:Uncharacterized protein n=1 Tax=Psittacicella gerlachiana TaxID=2028574 RepID=A0A3A1YBN1_9GAMM|nr:hypothetical protein [Psittacicella gerlachiana]RIY33507.1 hypothetical protein CKF59_06330 [Psittacicella gerlachiana]